MRYLMVCMLLCLSAGYSQETAESPVEITTPDEGSGEGDVAASDSFVDWDCGCSKNKDGKPK